MLLFTNGRVWLDGSWKTGFDIMVKDGKIVDIKPQGVYQDGHVIDAEGKYMTSGFIDIHIHGSVGEDVMKAKEESLQKISDYLAGNGTTAWLPTTSTLSVDDIRSSLRVIGEYMNADHKGAQVLGAHLEGPFLNPLAKGAHMEEFIILPTIENYQTITKGVPDIVRLVTFAPEQEGALDLVEYLKERNVTSSIGHTKGTYEECNRGIAAGMHHVCHFYNAMSPLNHREPGTVGAVLDDDTATIELIADLIHVHPAALRLAAKVKGRHKTVLITDALEAAGLQDGEYKSGGLGFMVRNGEARLPDGTLAGSTLSQDTALRNMVKIGVKLEDVIPMLTENPAGVVKADHYKGKLAVGYDADINVLDDDLYVKATYVQGKKVEK